MFVVDVEHGPSFPCRLPSYVFSIQVRCLSTNERFERPLQNRGPVEVAFVVRHLVFPLAIFVYGARDGTCDPLTLDEPRSKIRPMSDRVKRLPPESTHQPTGNELKSSKLARSYGSGMRRSP